jgi:hypothetical protein
VARFILSLLLCVVFLPAGIWTLSAAYALKEPHYFVMFIFSGSLMVLLGLAGAVGLCVGKSPKDE